TARSGAPSAQKRRNRTCRRFRAEGVAATDKGRSPWGRAPSPSARASDFTKSPRRLPQRPQLAPRRIHFLRIEPAPKRAVRPPLRSPRPGAVHPATLATPHDRPLAGRPLARLRPTPRGRVRRGDIPGSAREIARDFGRLPL